MVRRAGRNAVAVTRLITGFAGKGSGHHNSCVVGLFAETQIIADIAELIEHLQADTMGLENRFRDLPAQLGDDAMAGILADLVLKYHLMTKLIGLSGAEGKMIDPAQIHQIWLFVTVAQHVRNAETAIKAMFCAVEQLETVIQLDIVIFQVMRAQIVLDRCQAQGVPFAKAMIEHLTQLHASILGRITIVKTEPAAKLDKSQIRDDHNRSHRFNRVGKSWHSRQDQKQKSG